jgi:Fe-S-cluster-containing hydrogenase component 2
MVMSILSLPTEPLLPRDADVRLTDELLSELALLAPLQRRPALYRFRGSVALRRHRAGETIVRQGERRGSAFYILTAADVLSLLNGICRAARPRRPDPALLAERDSVRARVERRDGPDAVLRLVTSSGPRLARPGVPYPAELDPHYATLREGELVGEAACLEGTPQPVTIVAQRDCYLLEMKANFLAAVQDDPGQRARADAVYREHILRLQLGRLPLFRDLSDDEFGLVRDAVELRTASPGAVICEENDPCDGLYLVRGGVVKLVKNITPMLGADDMTDWTALRAVLRDDRKARSPRDAVWRRLTADIRAILSGPGRAGGPDPADRSRVLAALNEMIAAVDLLNEPELRLLATGVLPFGPGEAMRRANRLALESALSPAIRPLAHKRGHECVLTYCARGEPFGLTDLLLNRPFSASAVALGHPNALGRVDVAWLPAAAFWKLLREVPRLREPLKQETARQRRNAEQRLAVPSWKDQATQFSREAVELGLVQGQHLMLIDLDRCTRCDECVRACADSRDDGHGRLFLEGPRIGKHLVPVTCRACLDPVCLIGCPVGSIHRGPGQEVVIENWCIGCGLCGESCPYGAIQMHDLGIIPETSGGWCFVPAEVPGGHTWSRTGYRAGGWLQGSSPFVLDRTLREQVTDAGLSPDWRSFTFRHEFNLKQSADNTGAFRLEVVSAGELRVWVNGRDCCPAEKPRGSRHTYMITGTEHGIKAGSNVLGIEVRLLSGSDTGHDPLLQARLDLVPPDGSEESFGVHAGRPVTRRAAVCDLCAGQESGPICVHACPHDAARRVDARNGLPA